MTIRQRTSEMLAYTAPVALGLLVSLVGIAPWAVMGRLNASVHPDVPWAALAALVWMALYIFWLNGGGPPARWKAARRYRLRLWRPGSNAWTKGGIAVTLMLMGLIGLLALVWILTGAPERPADLSHYPSSAYLISVVVMGPLVSGIIEEAAFRGYMQRGLERHGAGKAIVISALMFALAHAVNGLGALPLLPGIFFAGLLYGLLAYHSGSIVPGMIMHFLGDLAFTFFAILGGDWQRLFVH